MEYVARKRARFNGIGGRSVNIPYGTVVECDGSFILWQGSPLCAVTSQNAYDFFSNNSDGMGMKRGALVTAIQGRLGGAGFSKPQDKDYQARWDKVWGDPLCQKYKRPEHEDHWIWNYDFYNAPIEDLRHIAALVGAKT